MTMDDVGALDIKAKIKAAAAAIAKNQTVKTAASAVAPGVLNDAKNAALKLAEKVAPGAGTAIQNYVTTKEKEYKKQLITALIITGIAAVATSAVLLKRKASL